MANDVSQYSTVIGEAFNIKESDSIEGRNFTIKSFVTGNYVNCTLWANSHGHVEIENGDAVVVNGKVKKTPKKDGEGFWINLSVGKIGKIPMDAGAKTERAGNSEASASDDSPDVM